MQAVALKHILPFASSSCSLCAIVGTESKAKREAVTVPVSDVAGTSITSRLLNKMSVLSLVC